jgi:hydrogenase large subunit
VQGGKIRNYRIVAPTTWNVGPRTSDGARPIEEALIGTPIANASDPVEVGHVCRSYDSCLVCTVHARTTPTPEKSSRVSAPPDAGAAAIRAPPSSDGSRDEHE